LPPARSRPGTMEKWGLDYPTLAAENPGLIMIRVSGFGQTGPYAGRAGFGAIGEAMGGLRHVVGTPDAPPSRVGISLGDTLAATYAALGAVIALHARTKTGLGQIVDSAIYEAVLAMMESLITEYQQAGYIRERTGPILPGIAPSNVYPTADGQMILIAANQDTVFRRLAKVMGRDDFTTDARYATHVARGERQAELDGLISAWSALHPAAELETLLEAAGVPAGRIYRAPEIMADPHVRAREAIVRVMHHEYGELAMQNVVPRLSATPGQVRHAAPALGADTATILSDLLGLGEAEQSGLKARAIV
jgi:formyl-CoA transferase